MLMITEDRREASEARRSVNGALGARCQTLAMDSSAEDLYADALDQMGIDHKGLTSTQALRRLFNLALEQGHKPKPRLALDSNDIARMAEKFPNAMRKITVL